MSAEARAAVLANAPAPPGALRIAALLVRFRLRYLWNGVRARGRGRFPGLIVLVALLTSVAYVGLFSQAFAAIVEMTSLDVQVAALSLVAATLAFGSLAARTASSEAVLAGSAENEFLLSRPVGLPTLVAARCLAESATDPFGALFLFPVLVAASLTWGLPPAAWALAALTSIATQLCISALAQAAQIALIRLVPRARRRAAWMMLRLVAALSLAAIWMLGTWVLRAPAELARFLAPRAWLGAHAPSALIAAPLAALVRDDPGAVALGVARLLAAAALTVLLAAAVARRAAARGWEEAGASWADASAVPAAGTRAGNRRPLTAATKDLRLITRDRAQLVALIAMPLIFVGVQLFGSVGWSWSTASLQRVTYLAFSLTLYMATIGPLAHMQAERRAFWILLTVPVPMRQLLAAKARAWSVLVGGTAAAAFAGLSLGAPIPSLGAWLASALLVVAGAVGMTWLAIALGSRAADLSDDQRPAVGPATIYTFLLVGGLYNVVLGGDTSTRLRGIFLYLFTLAAFWLAGIEQATSCLDPERRTARRVSLADGATMLVVYALGQRGAEAAAHLAQSQTRDAQPAIAAAIARIGVAAAVGAAALVYLARRRQAQPSDRVRPGRVASAAAAVALGGAAGLVLYGLGFPDRETVALLSLPWGVPALGAVALVLCEELIFRGVLQRGLEQALAARPAVRGWALPRGLVPAAAALIGAGVSVVAVGTTPGLALAAVATIHAAAAATWAVTRRTSAAWLARVSLLAVATALTVAFAPP